MTFEEAIAVLDVSPDAGPKEARRAYLMLLQKHGPEPPADLYNRFTEAYEVLMDPGAWPAPAEEPPPSRPLRRPVPDGVPPATRRRSETSLPASRRMSEPAMPASRRLSEPVMPASRRLSEPAMPASRRLSEPAMPSAPRHGSEPAMPASRGRAGAAWPPAPGEQAPSRAELEAEVAALLEKPFTRRAPADDPGPSSGPTRPGAPPATVRSPSRPVAATATVRSPSRPVAPAATVRSPSRPVAATGGAAPPGALPSEDPHVVEQVQRLTREHGDDVEAAVLLAALDGGQEEAVGGVLVAWMNDGRVLAAGAAARLVFELACERPGWRIAEPRSALRILARLNETVEQDDRARPAAAALSRSLDKWMLAVEERGVTLDPSVRARKRLAAEISALPEAFPASLRAVLASAIARGDAELVKPAVADFVIGHHAEAQVARELLRRHATVLYEALGPMLPEPRTRDLVRGSFKKRRTVSPWTLAAAGAVLLVVGVIGFLARGGGDTAAGTAEGPAGAVCAAAGEGTPACTWAEVVAKAIADRDCPLLAQAMPRLEAAAAGVAPAQRAAFDAAVAELAAGRAAACPP